MNQDLYFIPIVAEHSTHADRKEAFRQAFEKIQEMGNRPEYRDGFRQFQRWMDAIRHHAAVQERVALEMDELAILDHEMESAALLYPTLIIEFNGHVMDELSLPRPLDSTHTIGLDQPGYCRIHFNTGQVLAAFTLTEDDLFWQTAFPDQDFPVAAATDRVNDLISNESDLLGGEINIVVLRGIVEGRLLLTFRTIES